jgi:hypothetical protein
LLLCVRLSKTRLQLSLVIAEWQPSRSKLSLKANVRRSCSGGGTRTHNLRINTPLRRAACRVSGALTCRNVSRCHSSFRVLSRSLAVQARYRSATEDMRWLHSVACVSPGAYVSMTGRRRNHGPRRTSFQMSRIAASTSAIASRARSRYAASSSFHRSATAKSKHFGRREKTTLTSRRRLSCGPCQRRGSLG